MLTSSAYLTAFIALAFMTLLMTVQNFHAGFLKGTIHRTTPGQPPAAKDTSSFLYRVHRTQMNMQENIPVFMGSVIIAILAGFSPFLTNSFAVIFVVLRLGHAITYYLSSKAIGIRPLFFVAALLLNILFSASLAFTLLF